MQQREVGDEGEDRIGADVGGHVHAERGDGAVVSTAASRSVTWARPCVVAIMCSTRVSVHRSGHAVLAGERGQHDVLRVAAELHAEAAAHLGRDDAHEVLRHAERRRRGRCAARGAPGAWPTPRCRRVSGVGRGQDGARLHRHAAQPLADHPLLDHAMGLGEGRVGVARLDRSCVLDVLRRVVVELGRAVGHGGERVGDRGQRLPVDDHRGGAVGRGLVRGRDHGGHRLAHVAHAVHRERVVLPPDARSWPRRRPRRRRRRSAAARSGARMSSPGHDHAHAGQRCAPPRCRSRGCARGRGAAHEGHVVQAGQRDVGDVARRAGDQARVFLALDLGAHELGCHGGFVLLGQMIRQNAAACAARGFTAPARVRGRRSPDVHVTR